MKVLWLSLLAGCIAIASVGSVQADDKNGLDKQLSLDIEIQQVEQRLEQALKYLYQLSLEEPTVALDVEKVKAFVQDITKALARFDFDQDYTIALRFFRAKGIDMINLQRLKNDQPIDIAQVELALKDLDHVIANQPSVTLYKMAGDVAARYLDDDQIVASYLNKCADDGHLGCGVYMANHYFFGRQGFSADIEKSIYWHKKVVEGGIKFTCSAILSSHTLAHIQDSLPASKTGKTAKQWSQITHQLYQQLEQSEQGAYTLCDANEIFVYEYVMFIDDGQPDKTLLQRALSYEKDQTLQNYIKALIADEPIDSTITIVESIADETRRCDSYFDLLLIARAQKNTTQAKNLEQMLTTLDPQRCSFPLSTITHMQSAGVWD